MSEPEKGPGEGVSQRQGVRYVTITAAEAGQRIDNFLGRIAHSVPRSHVYRIIRTGQVRVNGGRIKPLYKLREKDEVRIPPIHQVAKSTVRVPDVLVERLVASIVFENDEFLLLNKPAGIAVHAGSGLHFGIIDAIRQHYESPRIELVHRLDRGTSGCLLLGKTLAATRRAQDAFRQGRVSKTYRAIVSGCWDAQDVRVDLPLAANTLQGGQHKVVVSADGKHSISHFRSLQQFNCNGPAAGGSRAVSQQRSARQRVQPRSPSKLTNSPATLVNVKIETGRTHQIRVHAAHSGHAVVGDAMYGNSTVNALFRQAGLKRMYLHAAELVFEDEPVLDFQAPPDAEWQQALQRLGELANS